MAEYTLPNKSAISALSNDVVNDQSLTMASSMEIQKQVKYELMYTPTPSLLQQY